MDREEKLMEELIKTAKEKKYSRYELEMIFTIVMSKLAEKLGYSSEEGLELAIEKVKTNENGRDCINSLIEIIK